MEPSKFYQLKLGDRVSRDFKDLQVTYIDPEHYRPKPDAKMERRPWKVFLNDGTSFKVEECRMVDFIGDAGSAEDDIEELDDAPYY